jgi:phosphopentomutase
VPRVILCVLDSFGIGGAPDAAEYGDVGANTLLHIAEACAAGQGDRTDLRAGLLTLPNLDALGLGAAGQLSSGQLAPGLAGISRGGRWGVGREVSQGKDTPSGHWEIAGVPVPLDWGYFPQSEPTFPPELIEALVRGARLPGILGNKHASGTDIIAELGEQSIRTGKPICYTSIDSVFQIAASETHFGLSQLYEVCELAFRLTEPLRVGRVIARPFVGETAATFKRTGNRRDFAIAPPEPTLLDRGKQATRQVFAIGKVSDIYATRGVTHKLKAHGNMRLFDATLDAMGRGWRADLHQFRRFRPGIRPSPRRSRLCRCPRSF